MGGQSITVQCELGLFDDYRKQRKLAEIYILRKDDNEVDAFVYGLKP